MLGYFRRSLGRKLLAAVGLPALAIALAGLLWVITRAQREVQRSTEAHLSSVTDIVIAAFSGAQPGPNPHGAVLAAITTDLGPGVKSLEVFDRDGVVKFARDPRKVSSLVPEEVMEGLAGRSYTRAGIVRPIRGTKACAGCHVSAPVLAGSAPVVLGGLRLDVDTPPLARDLADLYRNAIVAVILLALGVALAVWLSLRIFVRNPLNRLANAMRRAQSGDFLFRIPVESGDEVGELAEDFNTMLAAITDLNARHLQDEQSIESMQRELKLKAQVEAQHRLLDETNRRLEGRLRELTLLFDLTRSINSTLQLDEMLKLMTELVGGTLGFHEFVLLLVDDESGDLVVQSTFGIEEGFDGTRFKAGEGAVGWTVQERQTLLIRDTKGDPRFLHYKGRRPGDGSNLSVPMIYKDQCVGVLNFFRPVVDAFSEDEIRLLQSVANQAAMAIANARLHQQTVELSLTDALTGVYNRRHLFARLDMELTRAHRFDQPMALLMIDVDYFKHYNDRWGHPAGDQVLKRVAALVSGAVRKVDTVARYGGEEFAVLLPNNGPEQAQEVAEKLRRLVGSNAFEGGNEQPAGMLTISIGLACYPDDAADLAALVDCADSALYAAKKAGRNNVQVYSTGMREHPGRERNVTVTAAADPSQQ
jgi:diguanylate cyclase (GGDEF)-like protein